MKLKIEIDLDNAMFEDYGLGTAANLILRDVIDSFPVNFVQNDSEKIFDENGNSVGFWKITK